MEGVQAISVVYGDVVRRVLVYPGLSPLELSKLLTSAFGIGGAPSVVGFQDEQHGVVIPISLASSSAAAGTLLSSATIYRLLLTDTEDFLLPLPQQQQQQQEKPPAGAPHEGISPLQPGVAPSHSPIGVTPTSSLTLPAGALQPPQPPPAAAAAVAVPPSQHLPWQEPLARFLAALAEQGVLTATEHAALRELLEEGHIALAAAYRVAAARGGNRELLAAMCKRVAQGVLLQEGQKEGGGDTVLEEQGEMLRMLGHVVEEELVTPKQHTQLECLVLLQHERVYAVFNAYTQTGDADAFCDSLAALGDGAEALIAEAMGVVQPPPAPQQAQQPSPAPGAVRPLEEVVRTMGIRPPFQAWLLRQAQAGDEYILAAYEIYEFDKNEAELVDSLRRILKVRMEQRRVELSRYLQQQQRELRERVLDHQQHHRHQVLAAGGGRARSLSLPAAPREAVVASMAPPSPPPPPQPTDFAGAAQRLARQGRLSSEAARLLVGLHARGHEALAAAWSRYGRTRDEGAFADACARVARVASAAATAVVAGEGSDPEPEQEDRAVCREVVDAEVAAAGSSGRRAQTRTAILTQSLELMLSRGTLDLRGYRALARRLQAEDAALLGALDGFLADRDVEALLRRLAVLARPHPPLGANGGGGGNGARAAIPSPLSIRVQPPLPLGANGGVEVERLEEEETSSLATDRAVRMPPPPLRRGALAAAVEEDDESTIATAATPTPVAAGPPPDDTTPPEPPLRLGAEDREELLEILVSTGVLAEAERRLLAAAARREERALLGVFDAFARTQDVERFQRSLRKYALILRAARPLEGAEAGEMQPQQQLQERRPPAPARSPLGGRPRGMSDLTYDEGLEEPLPPAAGGGRSEEFGAVAKQLGSLSLAEEGGATRDVVKSGREEEAATGVCAKTARYRHETAALLQGLMRQDRG